MRLWGQWIKRDRRHVCSPPSPRARDDIGSQWKCRHGAIYTLRTNYSEGYRQWYRWEQTGARL